jgi:hypothetical protein
MTAPIKASDVPMQAGEPQKSAQWSTRIVGQGEEAPEQLLANPRNWRIHPKHQQDALQETLDRVGWVQSVIVNRVTGHVIDGHLRVGLAISKGEETIPVSYVELDDEEERLVLATLDPLAGMAVTDEGALKGLLGDLEGELPLELTRMMDTLTRQTGDVAPHQPDQEEIDAEADKLETRFDGAGNQRLKDVTCPECGNDFAISLDELG